MRKPQLALMAVVATAIAVLSTATACRDFGSEHDAELGTDQAPINMYFVPSSEAPGGLEAHMKKVADFVAEKTGLVVKAVKLSDHIVIEHFRSGEAHVAFMGPAGYARAYENGGRMRLCAIRYGQRYYYAMIVGNAERNIRTLADCAGKSFAHRGVDSTSGYIYPMRMFRQSGVKIGETNTIGSHDQVIRAVYDGTYDLGAAYWSPPVIVEPAGMSLDGFQIDRETGMVTLTNGMRVDQTGALLDRRGNPTPGSVVEIKDARERVVSERPDVYRKVRIIAITDKIPNDGVLFHSKLPDRITDKLIDALLMFAETEDGKAALQGMYNITGLGEINDDELAGFRADMLSGHESDD